LEEFFLERWGVVMGKDVESDLLKKIETLEADIVNRELDLARFREEVSAANDILQGLIGGFRQEIKALHNLQRVLIPTEIPNIQGFEFSSKFLPSLVSGGDYFDIFEHEDKLRFGVMVSSCTGYGVSALMLSILLKLTGQMEARRGAEPHLILEMIIQELAQTVFKSGGDDEEAHIFYSLIDRRSFNLSYCLAGNIVAIVQKYGSGELVSLKSNYGSIVKGGAYKTESQNISLNPRDRVIISSAGLISVKNLNGEAFGRERLYRAILSAPKSGIHELRNHILFEVKQFSDGQELKRDITLVNFEVKDRVIKLANS